jgi:hypothetical protein
VGNVDALGLDAWWTPSHGTAFERISIASWDDLSHLDVTAWTSSPDILPPGVFLETPSVSAFTYAAVATDGDIIAIEPPRAAIVGHSGDTPVVVGHTVLWDWSDATLRSEIRVGGLDASETTLFAPPAGSHVLGVRSDGDQIAWLGGADDVSGASVPLNELWVAPFRDSPPLSARLVRNDLAHNSMLAAVGEGMYAFLGADSSGIRGAIHVIDLATGSRRSYEMPFDTSTGGVRWRVLLDPAWVTQTEVVFPASREQGTTVLHTILRIDLTAIPPDASIDAGM